VNKPTVINPKKLKEFLGSLPRDQKVKYFNVFDDYFRIDIWCERPTKLYKEDYYICKSYFIQLTKDGEIVDKTIRVE